MFQLKKPLIIGGAMLATGAVLMLGSVGHANFDFGWEKGPKLIKVEKQTKTFKDVKKLNVNADASVIRIKEGEEFSVTSYSFDGKMANAEQKGDTLNVDAIKDESAVRGFFMSTPDAFQYSAEITVPRGTKLEELNLTMGDGGVIVEGGSAKHVKATSEDGGVNLSEFKGDTFEMKTRHGRLAMNDVTFKTLKLDGRQAGVRGDFVKLTDKSEIKTREGQITLSHVDVPGLNLSQSGDDSHIIATSLSEDEEGANPFNEAFYGAADGPDQADKQEKLRHEAMARKHFKQGNQDKALKISVQNNGFIDIYDLEK